MSAAPSDHTTKLGRETAARVLTLLQRQDEIAVDLPEAEQIDFKSLKSLLYRVHRRHQASGLFTHFPFGDQSGDQILGPGHGIPSKGAVILAFHAGAESPVGLLATMFESTPEEVGNELYHARKSVIGVEDNACQHMRSLTGRYADSSLDQTETAALVNHARACGPCSAILSEFRALDERIVEAVSTAPETEPAARNERARLTRNPLLLWIPIIIVIAIAIGAVMIIGTGAASRTGAAPLLSAGATDTHPGWLILSSEQEVMAFDLKRGERRQILNHPAHDWWNPMIISPGTELVVRWEEYSRGEERVGALRAYDMQGNRQFLHRWFGVRTRTFSGWLDDRTVLFAERGPIQRTSATEPRSADSFPSLVAADLETGREWVVFQGLMDRAVPSPDGSYIVIVRPEAGPWPGKSVEIRPVVNDHAGDVVASLEYRHMSWPGRILWSADSEHVFVPAIHSDDVPSPLPQPGEPAPGTFDLERLHLAAIGTDGSVTEFGSDTGAREWVVPQTVHPEGNAVSVVYNDSHDRDGDWYHGVIDLASGEFERTHYRVPGSWWWNSESLWTADGNDLIIQQIISEHRELGEEASSPDSLALQSIDSSVSNDPLMVFQDTSLLNLRTGAGIGLLRWVADEVMQEGLPETTDDPKASLPAALSQAASNQQLHAGSAVATTGRYVLLRQHEPGTGSRDRLLHLQAWAGTDIDRSDIRDAIWLPREAAIIGASEPAPEIGQGSRLVFVSTDRFSALHGLEIDPADIGTNSDVSYRRPAFSPNGANLAFYVHNHAEREIELWVDLWDSVPKRIDAWNYPESPSVLPTLHIDWTDNREFLYTHATQWDAGYAVEISLMRATMDDAQSVDTASIRSFGARGRDRGIDVVELAISPNDERVAFRLRHFTGNNPERNVSDSIHASPMNDTSQTLEIVRAGPGHGMFWLQDDQWLIAGINDRVALLEAMGRGSEYISPAPAAFPMQVGEAEVWYQDMSDNGRIMRVTFD
jgi:hypothetical protein